MAPGAISPRRSSFSHFTSNPSGTISKAVKSCLFNKNTNTRPSRMVVGGLRHTYEFKDGTEIYDASSGAAVSSIGRRQERVEEAIMKQMRLGLSYVPALALDTDITMELAQRLISTTDGKMREAIFYCSGMQVSSRLEVLAHNR
jgi:adenosylmethionine-8-amino-7-oxononanoate aminotransferase